MLGTVCFQLRNQISRYSTAVALLNVYQFSLFPCKFRAIRSHASANYFKRLSWSLHQQEQQLQSTGAFCVHSGHSSRRCCFHTRSCIEGGDEVSYATIWHGLLPSHYSLTSAQKIVASCPPFLPFPCKDHVEPEAHFPPLRTDADKLKRASILNPPTASYKSRGKIYRTPCFIDGSWNVAWDTRPARWLHGRHSAWLLFGVCTCVIGTTDASSPPENNPREQLDSYCETMVAGNDLRAQQKPVLKDYDIISISGDGRCLFRAVSYGAHVRMGESAPDEDTERRLADELRSKVVDELVKRRHDSEWFIEGSFEKYVEHMREHNTWGGEPELLMASHVLKMPITVYFYDANSGGSIPIAEYGLEHGIENPVRVLYDGSGHYDLIQVRVSRAHSKL